jgi:large repetitive protein
MRKLRSRTARSRGPVVALVCVLAFAAAPAVAHAGTLDQSQTTADTGGGFGTDETGTTRVLAQTFTAGLSGGLDQVDVVVFGCGTTGVDVTVQIRTVAAGSPTSTVLASATIAEASVPSTDAFVSAAFGSPAPVTAGTSYAIVLSANGAACPDNGYFSYSWAFQSGDPYPRGAPLFSDDGGATWTSPGPGDFAFKTYVATDSTPPTVSCSATPASLKSNNHKLAAITTSVTVTDEAGGSGAAGFTLVSVTSSQADSGLAADDVPNDIQGWTTGTADTSGLLRQERYGTDRVYTLTYQGSDKAGNTATCQTTVTVTKG